MTPMYGTAGRSFSPLRPMSMCHCVFLFFCVFCFFEHGHCHSLQDYWFPRQLLEAKMAMVASADYWFPRQLLQAKMAIGFSVAGRFLLGSRLGSRRLAATLLASSRRRSRFRFSRRDHIYSLRLGTGHRWFCCVLRCIIGCRTPKFPQCVRS